jgi:tRNA dimethylallyltransferase
LLEGYQFNPVAGDETIRNQLSQEATLYGCEYLHAKLTAVLPETAARLHPHDLRRVIRALEIHQLSGETVSQQKASSGVLYEVAIYCLTMPREMLYARINQRVDMMVDSGLLAEVTQLQKSGLSPFSQAMQGIGYKEMAAYLQGNVDWPTCIEKIKQASRNFAKRQLTFFRKMPYIQWIDCSTFADDQELMAYIYTSIAGKFHLE